MNYSATLKRHQHIFLALGALILAFSGRTDPFPIAPSSAPVFANSAAFDGANYLLALLSSTEVAAQRVSASGTLLGVPIRNIGKSKGRPQVAFASSNYLMVWQDDFVPGANLFGQRIGRNGDKIGPTFPLAATTGFSLSAIGSDGINFLTILRQDETKTHWAQRVSADGGLLGERLKINEAAFGGKDIAVAFDGANYFVVWNRAGTSRNSEIYGQFINPGGTPVGGNFLIDGGEASSDSPLAVAFDGLQYLVLFGSESGAQGSAAWDIFGRFVRPEGVVATERISITQDKGDQRFPSLAFDGWNYLVSWTQNVGTADSTLQYQFYDRGGWAASSSFSVFLPKGANLPALGQVLFDGARYAAFATLGPVSADLQLISGDVCADFLTPIPRDAFPIAITQGSEMGISGAFDGTNFLVAITGDASGPGNITAQRFTPRGVLLGPRISVGRTGFMPYVSFDGTNFLMVWDDIATRHIYGQFISPSGVLIRSPFAISAAAGKQSLDPPKPIIFDGSNYMVIWRDKRNGNDNADIYGRLIRPDGTFPGGEIPIATGPENQVESSVVFDGTRYFAIWQSRRTNSPSVYETDGVFISKDGVPGQWFVVSQTPSLREDPTTLAFGGGHYLIAWNCDRGGGVGGRDDWDIYARVMDFDGKFLGDEFPVTADPGSQPFPTAIVDGHGFLVSWLDVPGGFVQSRYFTFAGAPLSDEFSLFGQQGIRVPAGDFFSDGTNLLVVATYTNFPKYSTGDVYGLVVPAARLAISHPLSNGTVPLRFQGAPGITYLIQSATDLDPFNTVWTTILTSNSPSGSFEYHTPNGVNGARRYWRAIMK